MEKRYTDYLGSPVESYEALKEKMDIIFSKNREVKAEKRGEKRKQKQWLSISSR